MGFVASVSQNPAIGAPGRVVQGFDYDIFTLICSAAVPYGRGVVQVKGVTGTTSDDDDECQLPPNVPAADVDQIILTGVSTAGSQTYTIDGAAGLILDGADGGNKSIYGRPVQAVFNSHADWNATTMHIWGFGVDGQSLYDTITIPDAGNATVLANSGLPFAQVTKVVVPAQASTNGTFTLGYQGAATAVTVGAFGVAVEDSASQSTTGYAARARGNFLRKGRIWVTVENAVTRGQQAYLRHTSDGGSNTALGTWRGNWDAGRAAAWPKATFATAASAAGLAQLEVSL